MYGDGTKPGVSVFLPNKQMNVLLLQPLKESGKIVLDLCFYIKSIYRILTNPGIPKHTILCRPRLTSQRQDIGMKYP